MKLAEYRAASDEVNLRTLVRLVAGLQPFRARALSPAAWSGVLAGIYPIVAESRTESATLAREFYDYERATRTGIEDRHDLFLASYDPDWFYEAMEPARETFSREDATLASQDHVISRALKEVENAGRRTIIRATESDPAVKGWARVAGDRESCAFCLMLISRGPVYSDADSAGLNTDDQTAVELVARYERTGDASAFDGLMTRWHENCDCRVVPVFDRAAWPGRDDYLAAERIWVEASKKSDGVSGTLEQIRKDLATKG